MVGQLYLVNSSSKLGLKEVASVYLPCRRKNEIRQNYRYTRKSIDALFLLTLRSTNYPGTSVVLSRNKGAIAQAIIGLFDLFAPE